MTNNYLYRLIDSELVTWAKTSDRKPLLLRGARQVGKTTVVRKLAEHFEHFMEVNFEEHRDVHTFFEGNLSPDDIIENLSVYFKIPVVESKTLLFFDEIQACIPALSSLRFFYEKKQNLHIIAAGSLLEFALQSVPSYGVGRIRSIFLYPLCFDEFLIAIGEEALLNLRQKHGKSHPINEALHEKLIHYVKKFILLGGMPEVVKRYAAGEGILACQRVLDDLLLSYQDDFAKYKEKVPATRIAEVFNSVVLQLGGKFVLSKSSPLLNHYQIKEALDLLIKSGLVIPVTHSSANGIPLGARINPKDRKMLLIDTGLALRLSSFDLKDYLTSEPAEILNKGSIAELFAGLELLKSASPYEKKELYYWRREALNSNAEVDYVVQKNNRLVPIEIKSGTKGSMQSMFLFLKEKNIDGGVRMSLENFGEYQNILVFPLYAIRDFAGI